MLTKINVVVQSSQCFGYIDISATPNVSAVTGITGIDIYRKKIDVGSYEKIHSVSVSNIGDLTFNIRDITVVAGSKYNYAVDVVNNNHIVESGYFENIECRLEGLFIGNFEEYYVAGSNFKTDSTTNQQVSYVTTLAGRHPYRVSNAETNYFTGTSSGLFLELTDDRKGFKLDTFHTYSKRVLDFLRDGTSKILKTHDGLIYYVSIDNNPHYVYSEFWGVNAIEFSWTEIDDVPPFGVMVL